MLLPRIICMLAAAYAVLGADAILGQNYPTKPIRIITGEIGGGTDFAARLIATKISPALGQQAIVDNRASIAATAELVSKAPPDGYTLLLFGSSLLVDPLVQKRAYDPVHDFAPITSLTMSPLVLVVHPSVAVKSAKELIDLAKVKAGELNYATGGVGSANYLAAELFKSMAGINIVRINYKGSGPALNDLIGGHVHLMFGSGAAVTPHIKSGRLTPLAITSAQPSALAPGLPTIAATGLPGYESVSILGMVAPAKTPNAIIQQLNQEIQRALNAADVKEKFFASGTEVAGTSPDAFGAWIKTEMTRLGKIVKEAGIKAE